MPTYQLSFDAREGRFADGNALIQGWGDYNANNPLITKAALNMFETDVHNANLLVTATLGIVNGLRGTRLPLCFRIKDTNPDCLELRIVRIANYVESEIGKNSPAFKTIKRVLKLIRPQYTKKEDPEQPRGLGPSPSEKSFHSLVGQGDQVVAAITALGGVYAPGDALLSVGNITALVNQIRQLNKDVTIALDPYGNANRARKKIFDDRSTGMNKRIALIKKYLASFPGATKSDHYIEFSQAIKGV